jgi:alpha-tubulin suppressor-like RCC1 family protein
VKRLRLAVAFVVIADLALTGTVSAVVPTVELVTPGTPTDSNFSALMSDDGSAVAFLTIESITAGDDDGGAGIDVYLRSGGTTTLVSPDATPGSGLVWVESWQLLAVSPDGSRVLFKTNEAVLANDTDDLPDGYLWSSGVLTRVTPVGAFATQCCWASDDLTTVYFDTNEPLTAGDTDSAWDVYQSSGGVATLMSGAGADDVFISATSQTPSQRPVTPNGSHVLMNSEGQLTGSDTDALADLYVASTGSIQLVSTGPTAGNPSPMDNNGFQHVYAAPGGFVAYFQTDEQLVPGDSDSGRDLYASVNGTTHLLSSGACDTPICAQNDAFPASDGSRIFFAEGAQLLGGDQDTGQDVYAWSRATQSLSLVSTGPTASPSHAGFTDCCYPSADGSRVLFGTDDRLVSTDTDASFDSYVWDGSTSLVSTGTQAAGTHDAFSIGLSGDSSTAVFVTSERLTSDDADNDQDYYARSGGQTLLLDVPINNVLDLTADGDRLLFDTSNSLIAEDTDVLSDLYFADVPGGVILPPLDPPTPPKDATWAWGENANAQLGSGTTTGKVAPSEVISLPAASAVAAGSFHSLALRPDGTVAAWGRDARGTLGNGAPAVDQSTPVSVSGLTGVAGIAAGCDHSLARRTDGTVRAWGSDASGQLGDGAVLATQFAPVAVPLLTGVAGIAAGCDHSLAVRTDGTVQSWGSDASGQLGDGGALVGQPTPLAVTGLTGVVAVAGGDGFSLALRTDGTLRSWGLDSWGQLGDGAALTNQAVPVSVVGLTNVVAIAAGESHSLALRADGTVWSWGYDGWGQLGRGVRDLNPHPTPTAVPGLSNVVAIAAGKSHSLAIRSDGTVWAWGSNWIGQLGLGTIDGYPHATPLAVPGLAEAVAIAGGRGHSLAIGRASPTTGVESFNAAIPAGGTVTTDVENDGATPEDPVETTVTTPVAGSVSVVETTSPGSSPVDFTIHGRLIQINAPEGSVENPLLLRFRLDASVFQAGAPVSSLGVARNGVVVADCTGTGAVPDPCIESRTRLLDFDVEVVVRASSASDWVAGPVTPTADAGGPYLVAEGSSIQLQGSGSGDAAPLVYRWSDHTRQLTNPDIPAPRLTARDDGEIRLTLEVTDSAGFVDLDDTTVTVTNRPPVVSPIGVDENSRRRLRIGALFADPGRLDVHTAIIQWGDGSQSTGTVVEANGIGGVLANHQYARNGTYTIRMTVRDDDGGQSTVQRTVTVR